MQRESLTEWADLHAERCRMTHFAAANADSDGKSLAERPGSESPNSGGDSSLGDDHHPTHAGEHTMKKSTANKITRLLAKATGTPMTVASVALAVTGHLFAAWSLAMFSYALLVGGLRILAKDMQADNV